MIFKTITRSSLAIGRKLLHHQEIMASTATSGLVMKDEKSSMINFEKTAESFLENAKDIREEALLEPYRYGFLLPRKNILPELMDGFNYWLEVSEDDLNFVKEVVLMCREAYCMIDDIIDESSLRRGIPATHTIFGTERTIISAVSVYLSLIKKLHESKNPKAVKIIYTYALGPYSRMAETMRSNASPTKEEYMKFGIMKCSAFCLMILDLMQTFSTSNRDISKFVALFGFYVQVQNDIVNLSPKEFVSGKEFAEDIGSGTNSFPIMLAIEGKSSDAEIVRNIIRKKPKDLHLKNLCLSLIEKLGALEKAKTVESDLKKLVLQEIEHLGGNTKLVEVVNTLDKWKAVEIYPGHPEY